MGFESGMIQTYNINSSPGFEHKSILQHHMTPIQAISGLDNHLNHLASADAEGFIVIWNVRKEHPLKLLSIAGSICSLAMFGEEF